MQPRPKSGEGAIAPKDANKIDSALNFFADMLNEHFDEERLAVANIRVRLIIFE